MPSARDSKPTLFATTRWTLVVEAARSDAPAAIEAFDQLVRTYWQPLYRYARRKGRSPEDAEDLVQGFMLHLIEGESLAAADSSKGRFRAFLLACFNHWMSNERRHATRKKRGGTAPPLSLDWQSAECGLEPPDLRSPDHWFDRDWALTLLDKVLGELESVCRSEGGGARFEALKPCLTTDSARIPYPELATELGMAEGALRVAVHRLRKRYRQLLTREVTRTLASPENVEDEMRSLFAALSS